MVHFSYLLTLLLVATVATAASSPLTLAGLYKRDDVAAQPPRSAALQDYASRLRIFAPDAAKSTLQTKGIINNMQMGLAFWAMADEDRKSGANDEAEYLVGDPNDVKTWGVGAYSQARSCLDASNQTLFDAMQECGPKKSCDADFVMMTYFGTLPGMNWKKDGLLLYQCFALKTVKSQCKDPSKPPCKFTILGDFHETMLYTGPGVDLIGSGATTVAQMAQDIAAYNQANHKSFSLPTVPKAKHSGPNRLK